MTPDLGKISAVLDMISSIKSLCMTYDVCKGLLPGMTNKTMDDLVAYRAQLEKKLAELKKS